MFQKSGFKVSIVLFSLTAGGALIWKSSREMTSEVSDSGEVGGDGVSSKRPLMSGSKTRSEMLMEVCEAWELAVPPLETNSEAEGEK